jgi:hypothetical protein
LSNWANQVAAVGHVREDPRPASIGALTVGGGPQHSDVVAMLATYGDRQPEQVPETISSLELAWLLHQIEQRSARWTSTTTCSSGWRR